MKPKSNAKSSALTATTNEATKFTIETELATTASPDSGKHLNLNTAALDQITALNDRLAIKDLTARYALAMDEHDINSWLATWHIEGVWQGGLGRYRGHEELPNLLRDLGERNENRRHIITNHVIELLSESEARQTCYMQIVAYKGGCRVVGTAVYRDRLSKAKGQWYFLERQMNLDT